MINFMQLQAVIWDMDGVILNSEPVHYRAKNMVFEKYKIAVNADRIQRSYGMTDRQVIQFVTDEQLPEDVIDRMVQEKNVLFRRFISEHATFLPGVQKWMELFKQNGVSQALASSSSEANINLILDKLDAAQYFNEVISGETMPSKPDPIIFLKAADLLGVIPLNCLVFEDAIAGVQAAKAAGMKCIAVTTINPAEKLADADLVLNNLAEMMTDHILDLF